MVSPQIAKSELRARAFALFPQEGIAFDGSAIRRVSGGLCAQEANGYMCSPIAYSCRAASNHHFVADVGERALNRDELLTIIIAAECREDA